MMAPDPRASPHDRALARTEAGAGVTSELAAARAESGEKPASEAYADVARAAATEPTLVDLSTVPIEPVRWLWPGLLPLGMVSLLDGDPGLGKSLLTLDIAARVTNGQLMPDGTRGHLAGPRGVIFLNVEDPLSLIRERLEAAGADLTLVRALTAVPAGGGETRLPTLADVDAIRIAIPKVNAAAVFVDPFMAYIPSDRDSHRDQDIRAVLAPLAKLAEETGVAITVVRHLNKKQGLSSMYRGGGSIGIIGACRAAFLVAKDPSDEHKRVLACTKINIAREPPALSYEVISADGVPRISWLGPSSATADQLVAPRMADTHERPARDAACAFLEAELAEGPVPTRELQQRARRAGHKWASVRRAGESLGVRRAKMGQPGEDGQHWVWSLPSAESAHHPPAIEGAQGELDLEHLRQDRPETARDAEDAHALTPLSTFGAPPDGEHLRPLANVGQKSDDKEKVEV